MDPFIFISENVNQSIQQLKHEISNKNYSVSRMKQLEKNIEIIYEDIDELYDSIEVIQNDPQRWNMNKKEIDDRKNKLSSMEKDLKNIVIHLKNNETTIYIIDKQDRKLEDVQKGLSNLHQIALTIKHENNEQETLINEIDEEMYNADSRIKKSIRKLDKVITEMGNKSYCIVILLILILVVVIMLIFVL